MEVNYPLIEYIQKNLDVGFLKREFQNGPSRSDWEIFDDWNLYGHCYVASETYYHASGDKGYLKPYCVKHCGVTHWFLKDKDGVIIDITANQFKHPDKIPYDKAVGKGFLTKQPSKRSRLLRIKLLQNVNIYSFTGSFIDGVYRRIYLKRGYYHCRTGPAIEHLASGYKEWWVEGFKVSAQEVFDQLTLEEKEKALWEMDKWR